MRTGKGGIIFVLKLSTLAAVKVTFTVVSIPYTVYVEK